MRRFSIVLLTGLAYSNAPCFGRADELPAPAADVPVRIKLLISEEQDGKREILSRPMMRTLSGQAGRVELGHMGQGNQFSGITAEVLPVVDAEVYSSSGKAKHPAPNIPKEGASLHRAIPINLEIAVTRVTNGQIGPKLLAHLRVWNGELTVVKVGQLEVQLTATVLDEDPEKRARAEFSREELRLLCALQLRTPAEFHNTPLQEVTKELAKRAEVNIVLDSRALDDAGLTPHSEVTASAHGLKLSTVLDQILLPLGLDYIVADEVIKVTTRTRARGEPVTVTYQVADLIAKTDNGKVVPDADAERNLIDQITETLSPETWDRQGGRGSVRVFQATHSLVVRQVADVHDEIAVLLGRLRAARNPTPGAANADDKPAAIASPAGRTATEVEPLRPD